MEIYIEMVIIYIYIYIGFDFVELMVILKIRST